MYCPNCGKEVSDKAKFCNNCGMVVARTAEEPKEAKKEPTHSSPPQPTKKAGRYSLWSWSVGEDELREQFEGYDTLGWGKSYRKGASLLLVFSAGITLLFAAAVNPLYWVDVVLLIILALFVWSGSRVALVLTMLYWTASKIYLISQGSSPITQILWWALFMSVFWKAFRVEQYRAKVQK